MGGHHVFSLYQAPASNEAINGVVTLTDGKLLIAGEKRGNNAFSAGTSVNALVARLHADGSLDTTFGTSGWIELDHNAHIDRAVAITVLPDQHILVAAEMASDAYGDFAIIKLQPNGRLDQSFGMTDHMGARRGYNVVSVGGESTWDRPAAMGVQQDGRIVVAGSPPLQTIGSVRYRRGAIVRFTQDGQLDPGFGHEGITVLPAMGSPQRDDIVTGIALDAHGRLAGDDRITVVGHSQFDNRAFVARLLPDGSLDRGFGEVEAHASEGGSHTGYVRFSATLSGGVHAGLSQIQAARLLDDGRIILGGLGTDRGFTFMRLHDTGAIDAEFGVQGRVTVKFSAPTEYDELVALAIQANGKLVATGRTGSPNRFMVARVHGNGTPDLTFDAGSASRTYTFAGAGSAQARVVSVQPDGRLIAAGFAEQNGNRFAMLRLIGDPDRLFANGFDWL